MLDTDGFADPWEQLRLLSDTDRSDTLLALLRAHAPGRVVCEVGAGTGAFSLAAAALGARHVYAIEPSPLHRTISALVEANGLTDRVTVIPAAIQEARPPRGGVDLAFSELLNVDPFAEEILEAMDAAAGWLSPSGCLAPSTLTLRAALVSDRSAADEHDRAHGWLASLSRETGLDLSPLRRTLTPSEPYTYAAPEPVLLGPPSEVCVLPLGQGAEPPERVTCTLRADRAGAVGGVAVWFEADYSGGLSMSNRPGQGGHWGTMVCGWPAVVRLGAGEVLRVHIELGDGVVVTRA